MERAVSRLNAANEKTLASLPGQSVSEPAEIEKPQLRATVSATVDNGEAEPSEQAG